MPEGPSVLQWGEVARQFTGREINRVEGNTKTVNKEELVGCRLNDVKVYGKELFLQFVQKSPVRGDERSTWIRYHFLMWGSLRANEYKGISRQSKTGKVPVPRLVLHFAKEEFLAFYGGSMGEVDSPACDQGTDILTASFDVEKATDAIQHAQPVCYTLLDQTCFSGLGNIIKNEVLYAAKVHPLQPGNMLSRQRALCVVEQALAFSSTWMEHKDEHKKFKEHWQIYFKKDCPLGHKTSRDWFGPEDGLQRVTTWCSTCQLLEGASQEQVYPRKIGHVGKRKRSASQKGGKSRRCASTVKKLDVPENSKSSTDRGKRSKVSQTGKQLTGTQKRKKLEKKPVIDPESEEDFCTGKKVKFQPRKQHHRGKSGDQKCSKRRTRP
ncbi:endonuclease 8-like 2 [Branchiostoma floridae]|uniref:Endonuclease 8-like 2 n=1 Tax=Branchiostoma floridae TaxID=7739 RepID=A0A9J7L3S1_BRAFL|nr:endonuclease 8-like 2 [Branchiostoma floridae]XP_035675684.1 endonuclease 8-like 2 [Branchiostoma floridae]